MSKLTKADNIVDTNDLFNDVKHLIETSKQKVAHYANSTLVTLYWNIGRRVSTEVLKNQRAEYGENVISNLSAQLSTRYGKGFSRPNLFRMLNFYKVFPDENIVSTLSRQLGWSHLMLILPIKDDIKRDFYTQMSLIEKWVVRDLKEKIGLCRKNILTELR